MNSKLRLVKETIDSIIYAKARYHNDNCHDAVDIRLLSSIMNLPYVITLDHCKELVESGKYELFADYIGYKEHD